MLKIIELNAWLGYWEPTWLLVVLLAETFVGLFSALVLLREYFYDLQFNESIKASRKERRRKKYEFQNLCEGESK